MKRRNDDLITAFVAGACFGSLIGLLFMALVRSFFW